MENNERCCTYCAPDTRSWRRRLAARLFPTPSIPIPKDLDGWAPSYLVTAVVASLDWKDRLRVLVSGKVCVHTRTKTDVTVGRMFSESVIYV